MAKITILLKLFCNVNILKGVVSNPQMVLTIFINICLSYVHCLTMKITLLL